MVKRGSTSRTTSREIPSHIAVVLRSGNPSTNARNSPMKLSASVENPHNFGSCPTTMVSASPFMYPTCTSFDSRSATKPKWPRPRPSSMSPHDHRHHPRQHDSLAGVVAGHDQRCDRGEDQRPQRRVGTQHQDPARTHDRISDETGDRGVQAVHRRQPGELGVRHALRNQDGRQHDPGDEIRTQPAALVGPQQVEPRHVAFDGGRVVGVGSVRRRCHGCEHRHCRLPGAASDRASLESEASGG